MLLFPELGFLSCVSFWHLTDMPMPSPHVRSWEMNGLNWQLAPSTT